MVPGISLKKSNYAQPHLSFLPSDVLICILKYLPVRSVVQCGLASRYLYQVQSSESLWKFFCYKDHSVRSLPKGYESFRVYYQNFEEFLHLPFPGESGDFQPTSSQNWRVNYYESFYCIRKLEYISLCFSLFDRFYLKGDTDGDVSLTVIVSENVHNIVHSYFKLLSFEEKEPYVTLKGHFSFINAKNRKKIFKIIKTFNHINTDSISLAERIACCTTWHTITPLSKKEAVKVAFNKQRYRIACWIQNCVYKIKFSRF